MTEHSTKTKQRNNKVQLTIIIGVIVILLGGFLVWLYSGQFTAAKANVFRTIPLPIAIIDKQVLTGPELVNRLDLARKLTSTSGNLSADVRDQVYAQLIEAKKVQALAANHHLSISSGELNNEFDKIVTEETGGDKAKFNAELKDRYGMTEQRFKNSIVKQELLRAKLAVWLNQQKSLNNDAYKRVDELMGKLNSGESFDDIATEYTQDEATKDFAGDNGFVAIGNLLPEFQTALKDASPNETRLVVSRFGLHIVKVLEKDSNGNNGAERLHLQQIFVLASDYDKWFKEQSNNLRVIKLLNI